MLSSMAKVSHTAHRFSYSTRTPGFQRKRRVFQDERRAFGPEERRAMIRGDVFVLGDAALMHGRPDGKNVHPLHGKRFAQGLLEKPA